MSHQMTITSEGETRGDEADDSTGVRSKSVLQQCQRDDLPKKKIAEDQCLDNTCTCGAWS